MARLTLLINGLHRFEYRSTNQGVGSSNLSGRANLHAVNGEYSSCALNIPPDSRYVGADAAPASTSRVTRRIGCIRQPEAGGRRAGWSSDSGMERGPLRRDLAGSPNSR
jgi:hypothetical protein